MIISGNSGIGAAVRRLLLLSIVAAICALVSPAPSARAAGPSVVQFSAATYNVQEGMTFRTITVLRTGDVSGPATVDFTWDPLESTCRHASLSIL